MFANVSLIGVRDLDKVRDGRMLRRCEFLMAQCGVGTPSLQLLRKSLGVYLEIANIS